MFNPEIKERFLESLNMLDSSKTNFRYILSKAERTESALNKDVCMFNPKEDDALLNSFPRRSEGVIAVTVSCFKQYFDFCKSINLIPQEEFNYFESIKGRADLERYIDKTAINNKHISFDELIEIENLCANEQDAVIPELFYVGLGGDQASELLNLKLSDVIASYVDKDDIKVPPKIVLQDREIMITERTYDIIRSAIQQGIYLKANGENNDFKSPTMEINPSDYVLRPAGKTRFGQLEYSTFLMRVNRIKQYFGNPYINPTSLKISGQVYMAQKIKEEKGELTKEDYLEIGRVFGSTLPWNVIKSKIDRYLIS
jgi:hypothetical protein